MNTVDYNTERPSLAMPEYGRMVQQMVDYAKTIADAEEREKCARSIVAIMEIIAKQNCEVEDINQKLWNHLAAISNYELDINYPVEIEKISNIRDSRESIPYPQQRIARRHYGAIVEKISQKIAKIDDPEAKRVFTEQVANQMKRSLGRWNRDAMTNDKIIDDLSQLSGISTRDLNPEELRLQSDNEILNEVQQMSTDGKKKKKKKKK